ncbi:MAG: hypothetical protein UHH87_04045 [Akkermansia sp.]|nr:hypothetical protein [Akkermansia sp.]
MIFSLIDAPGGQQQLAAGDAQSKMGMLFYWARPMSRKVRFFIRWGYGAAVRLGLCLVVVFFDFFFLGAENLYCGAE